MDKLVSDSRECILLRFPKVAQTRALRCKRDDIHPAFELDHSDVKPIQCLSSRVSNEKVVLSL